MYFAKSLTQSCNSSAVFPVDFWLCETLHYTQKHDIFRSCSSSRIRARKMRLLWFLATRNPCSFLGSYQLSCANLSGSEEELPHWLVESPRSSSKLIQDGFCPFRTLSVLISHAFDQETMWGKEMILQQMPKHLYIQIAGKTPKSQGLVGKTPALSVGQRVCETQVGVKNLAENSESRGKGELSKGEVEHAAIGHSQFQSCSGLSPSFIPCT